MFEPPATWYRDPASGVSWGGRRSFAIAALVALAALETTSAAAQTAALIPVRSPDPALATSVEDAIRDAMIGAGYLLQSGTPVVAALGQLGLTEITSTDQGRRLGNALGIDTIVSAVVERTWISVGVMHLPSESIEVREGELPAEGVNIPMTVVANLADSVRVMRQAGVQIPEIPPPPAPPPVEAPPAEPPPGEGELPIAEPPPTEPEPPTVEPVPTEPAPDEPAPDEPPPAEPPAYHGEGPLHLRIFPAFNVLLDEPARPGGVRTGGRVGVGLAYALLPQLDVGLEMDVYFGPGTAIDLGASAVWRFPISHRWQIAPHLAIGYYQLLTGAVDPMFFLRVSGDVVWTFLTRYSLYFSPVGFTLVAGSEVTAGLYEAGLGCRLAF